MQTSPVEIAFICPTTDSPCHSNGVRMFLYNQQIWAAAIQARPMADE
jgi:hypothetical protein